MKLKLNKKKLKNLSKDNKALPLDMTPQIGGASPDTDDGWACNPPPKPIKISEKYICI